MSFEIQARLGIQQMPREILRYISELSGNQNYARVCKLFAETVFFAESWVNAKTITHIVRIITLPKNITFYNENFRRTVWECYFRALKSTTFPPQFIWFNKLPDKIKLSLAGSLDDHKLSILKNISKLSSLHLDVYHCEQVPFKTVFANSPDIDSLHIAYLPHLFDQVTALTKLTHLSLWKQKFLSLNDTISTLTSLQHLELHDLVLKADFIDQFTTCTFLDSIRLNHVETEKQLKFPYSIAKIITNRNINQTLLNDCIQMPRLTALQAWNTCQEVNGQLSQLSHLKKLTLNITETLSGPDMAFYLTKNKYYEFTIFAPTEDKILHLPQYLPTLKFLNGNFTYDILKPLTRMTNLKNLFFSIAIFKDDNEEECTPYFPLSLTHLSIDSRSNVSPKHLIDATAQASNLLFLNLDVNDPDRFSFPTSLTNLTINHCGGYRRDGYDLRPFTRLVNFASDFIEEDRLPTTLCNLNIRGSLSSELLNSIQHIALTRLSTGVKLKENFALQLTPTLQKLSLYVTEGLNFRIDIQEKLTNLRHLKLSNYNLTRGSVFIPKTLTSLEVYNCAIETLSMTSIKLKNLKINQCEFQTLNFLPPTLRKIEIIIRTTPLPFLIDQFLQIDHSRFTSLRFLRIHNWHTIVEPVKERLQSLEQKLPHVNIDIEY